jgi:sugar phosphate isomerase/epimerase
MPWIEPNAAWPRRRFLGSLAAAAAGTAAVSRPAPAIEPIARHGAPQFKLSLAAYSFRDLLTAKPPQMTLPQLVDLCAGWPLEGVELTSYYFPPNPTPEYILGLKRQAFLLGLEVSGTAVGNDFCHPPGPDRDREIAGVKAWIDRAAQLGAPVIRIFSGSAKQGQSLEEARRLAVEAIEECCEHAGRRGVFLALENHGGLTAEPAGILALVRAVQSPWFGVNLDTGNFHGADVYADLAQLAPYAVNVQVKVVITPAGGPKQPTDFSRIGQILRDAGYRGYVALEYEEDEDPRTACPRYLEQMRAVLA